VYSKFSTQRLLSIYQHEQKKEEAMHEVLRPAKSESDLQMVGHGGRKLVGKFPPDSKIGFVSVFFDEMWAKHLLLTEEEI